MVRKSPSRLIVCILAVGLAGCAADKEVTGTVEGDGMIVDRLANAANYCDMHAAFEQAFAFLRRADLADLPDGRHEIDGDRLFCLISRGPGRRRDEAPLEAHRRYIDIQYVIDGADEMGWKPTAACAVSSVPYDPEKDIDFFKDAPDRWIVVPAGSFAVFFPRDAHAPLVGAGHIHKAVLKIAVEPRSAGL
jgi:YhcH/YjgK/YiaL family protein